MNYYELRSGRMLVRGSLANLKAFASWLTQEWNITYTLQSKFNATSDQTIACVLLGAGWEPVDTSAGVQAKDPVPESPGDSALPAYEAGTGSIVYNHEFDDCDSAG